MWVSPLFISLNLHRPYHFPYLYLYFLSISFFVPSSFSSLTLTNHLFPLLISPALYLQILPLQKSSMACLELSKRVSKKSHTVLFLHRLILTHFLTPSLSLSLSLFLQGTIFYHCMSCLSLNFDWLYTERIVHAFLEQGCVMIMITSTIYNLNFYWFCFYFSQELAG